MGVSPATAGLLGGMAGGVAQAYATMGESWKHEALPSYMMHSFFGG
jgi:hypothetical protein